MSKRKGAGTEIVQIIFALLLMAYLISFAEPSLENYLISFGISAIILIPHIIAHKAAASYYLASAEFKLLEWRRYWIYEDSEFKWPFPIWLILPLIMIFLSKGALKFFAIETFEVKWEPRRRIGRWYAELQENEIAMIGLAGPMVNIFFAFISGIIALATGFLEFKEFAILNMWFAFFTLLPFGSLDGTKVLFGGRIRWIFFFVLTLIMLVLMHFLSVPIVLIIALIVALLVAFYFLRIEIGAEFGYPQLSDVR